MVKQWRQLAGADVEGKYRLLGCLMETGVTAVFTAETVENEGSRVLVKLRGGGEADEHPFALLLEPGVWEHPNLLRVIDFGRAEIDGMGLVYTITEWADEHLAGVLAERPLTDDEAAQVLVSVLNGLSWIHAHGLVHGEICPQNIFAAGENIKLSTGAIGRPGGTPYDSRPATPYDAPEIVDGGVSSASDVWSLGVTLYEVLTQRLPDPAAPPEALPQPFRDIVENCLRRDPARRWTLEQIRNRYEAGAAAPVVDGVPEAPPHRRKQPVLIYAAVVATVLLTGAILLRSRSAVRAPAEPPVRSAAETRTTGRPSPYAPRGEPAAAETRSDRKPYTPVPRATAPAEAPEAARSEQPPPTRATRGEVAGAFRGERPYWRVIVYTFSRLEDAQQKAGSINRRWPEYRAEVFSPAAGQPPYLIAIGGRMSREEADRLRAAARSSGLPRDSYIQNYSR